MKFVLDFNMVRLSIGLVSLIGVNILLGSIDAFFQGNFDKDVFKKGFIKGLVVAISFTVVYFVGVLNPDITLEIAGQEMTMIMAVNAILLIGFGGYGVQVLAKLKNMLLSKLEKPQDDEVAIYLTDDEAEKLLGSSETIPEIDYTITEHEAAEE
jgi:small basic protein